jgi:hypothetical protein
MNGMANGHAPLTVRPIQPGQKAGISAMDIRGVPYGDVERIIAHVSGQKYGNNITSNPEARPLTARGGGFRGRLVARDSRGPGSRTSASGRHGRYACWHAYRDVLAVLFREYPDARVRTGMAHYVGRAGFEETYPATAWINVGSLIQPAYMPDLCQCATPAPRDDVNYDTDHDTRETGDTIAAIDALLAEVAADGWTNPYTDPDSPARKLAGTGR